MKRFPRRKGLRRAVPALLVALAGFAATPAAAPAALPAIHHVFIIVLENENEGTSFGPGAPSPYLAQTLPAMGGFLPNYYAVGHASLDNYIAMISGQAPDAETKGDCGTFSDFAPTAATLDANGQASGSGCVYPSAAPAVPTIADQLTSAGDTWKGYMQSMSSPCLHSPIGSAEMYSGTPPNNPSGAYATRHDPFMYFHSIIDSPSCASNVVNLSALSGDLSSVSTTPNYVFITPDVCSDGHDSQSACQSNYARDGGYGGIDEFLLTYVPMIKSSPAFQQDGLLAVIFDESANDDTSCCGEIPGPNSNSPGNAGPGSGGGQVGAVLVSPFIKGGTTSSTAYNHYSLLASIEDLFGLPRLGMAGVAGLPTFGPDVYNALAQTPAPAPAPVTPTAPIAPVLPAPSQPPTFAARCASGRSVTIKLTNGKKRLVKVKVTVDGRAVKFTGGKHPKVVVNLAGRVGNTVTVVVTGRSGRRAYRSVRHYSPCRLA